MCSLMIERFSPSTLAETVRTEVATGRSRLASMLVAIFPETPTRSSISGSSERSGPPSAVPGVAPPPVEATGEAAEGLADPPASPPTGSTPDRRSKIRRQLSSTAAGSLRQPSNSSWTYPALTPYSCSKSMAIATERVTLTPPPNHAGGP